MQNKNNKTHPEKQIIKSSLEQIFKESSNVKRLGMIQGIISLYHDEQIKDNEAMAVIKKMISSVEYSEINSKKKASPCN